MPTYDELALGGAAVTRDRTREVFGQVMGLVALTVGCAALGANIGRDLSGGTGLLMFVGAFTIFDFNRLRRANMASAVPIAAGIFLDIFNIFLLMLRLFGNRN